MTTIAEETLATTNLTALRRRLQRSARRGVTLVEVLIVVAIMAVIAVRRRDPPLHSHSISHWHTRLICQIFLVLPIFDPKATKMAESPEKKAVYFGSLTVEGVKCFKGKETLDLTDDDGKQRTRVAHRSADQRRPAHFLCTGGRHSSACGFSAAEL